MAESTTQFEHLVEHTHKLAENMAKSDKSAEGLNLSLGKLFAFGAGMGAAKATFSFIVERMNSWQALTHAVSKENLSLVSLHEKELGFLDRRNFLTVKLAENDVKLNFLYKSQLETLNREVGIHEKQVVLAKALNDYGHVRLGLLSLYVAAVADLYVKEGEFNQNLIKANSSYEHRNDLLYAANRLQAQTGASFDTITHSAAALAQYGLDTKATFGDNLRIVTQMEQGLGVGVNESARLAAVVENQLHGSFLKVADVVADIVNNTALAGDEAVHLAETIGRAMSRLGPGISAGGLPDVLRLAGRYESALKEVGGAPADLAQLVDRLTSAQGITSQGMLGINPNFIGSTEGFARAMDQFGRVSDGFLRNATGQNRLQLLQQLGDLFGMSADQANLMTMAVKQANTQQGEQITLQQRWTEQMNSANNGISRLGSSLWALVQRALLPVVNVVAGVANQLANWLNALMKFKTAVYISVGVVAVAGFTMALMLKRVAVALWDVTTASVLAARALKTEALTNMGGTAAGSTGVLGKLIDPYVLGNLLGKSFTFSGIFQSIKGALNPYVLGNVLGKAVTSLQAAKSVVSDPYALGSLIGKAVAVWRALPVIGLLLNPITLSTLALGALSIGVIKLWQHSLNKAAEENRRWMAEHAAIKAGNSIVSDRIFSDVRFNKGNAAFEIKDRVAQFERMIAHTSNMQEKTKYRSEEKDFLEKAHYAILNAEVSKHALTNMTKEERVKDDEQAAKLLAVNEKQLKVLTSSAQQDGALQRAQTVEAAKARAAWHGRGLAPFLAATGH